MYKAVSLLLLVFLTASCTTHKKTAEHRTRIVEEIKTWYVAPYQVDCTGVGPQKCLLVKHALDARWQNFYSPIEGFDFETGNSYILKVKETPVTNPPADASAIRYELLEIVEKSEVKQPLQSLYDIWGVIRVNGENRLAQQIPQTIEINTNQMTIMGEAGCNNYRGHLNVDEPSNKINFINIVSTRKTCPYQQQENDFLKALESIDAFYRYNQNLLLISNGQVVIQARHID